MKKMNYPGRPLSRSEQKKVIGGLTYCEYSCVTEHCHDKCINVPTNTAICYDRCLNSSTVAAACAAGCFGQE
jgi:hypothetical protein